MLNMSFIKFVTVFLITLQFYHTSEAQLLSEDLSPTILDKPLCILKDYDDSKPTEGFKQFAKFEECQFQLFMDKLEQIDCYIMHKINNNYSCDNQACLDAVFGKRSEIYLHRMEIYNCICENPRVVENTNKMAFLLYNIFSKSAKNAEDAKLDDICSYMKCWIDLYTKMNEFIKNELEDIKKENEDICETIGAKNYERCAEVKAPDC